MSLNSNQPLSSSANWFQLTPLRGTDEDFVLRQRARRSRTRGRKRGKRQTSLSLRDQMERRGCGEVGGFVANRMVRSNFLDEGGNLGEIVGFVQKSGLLQV